MKFLVVGAGFSGTVLARELVERLDCSVEVWDERGHVAGNCHTERDPRTGVMLHCYGPHIFNTDNERVWHYVQKFGEFGAFVNRVKAHTRRGVFSLPINLLTINQFFGKAFSPSEAREFIAGLGDKTIGEPRNFEEQALKTLGRELYETFFRDYTIKQWGTDPCELPAAVLKRLPVRFNYDDNYYNKKYQGIPVEGYTALAAAMLGHPRITVRLGRKFEPRGAEAADFAHTFYTGPLDAFFDYRFGRLGYRTVTFERVDTEVPDYQGAAVIHYPDRDVPWTRIREDKHFTPWESHERTVAFREYSRETGEADVPYYPKRTGRDLEMCDRYLALAAGQGHVSFLGRLATYRYMDMEAVAADALALADDVVDAVKTGDPLPPLPKVMLLKNAL